MYLVGSIVLVSLAGCGRGFFQEREPWRAEAEIACLKSGAVKESADIVRIEPISGPGMCGADYPLKVAAIGETNASYGFADESLRPPAAIGGPFQLTDQSGAVVTEQSLQGRPTLIFFGFTHCPDVCPTSLFEISEVLRAMGKDADSVNAYFISVDPERDNPATMKDYLSSFDPH
ncbi:SCO family protein, partial [Bradyrhizobium sp.]|uniref:SCO family protein n=1 Tax=Bradyrhizobium sp. TaxID=376 RepID=UPI00290A2030